MNKYLPTLYLPLSKTPAFLCVCFPFLWVSNMFCLPQLIFTYYIKRMMFHYHYGMDIDGSGTSYLSPSQ